MKDHQKPKKRKISRDDFWKLYDEFSDKIFRFCYYKTSDRDIALDITQDVFLKAWKYISSGNEVSNHQAFLFRIAHNLVIDFYKKSKAVSIDSIAVHSEDREEVLAYEIPDPESMTHMESIDVGILKDLVMKNFEDEDRTIILMRAFEGMSVGDVADTIGKDKNYVSVKYHRLIKKLKKKKKKKENEF